MRALEFEAIDLDCAGECAAIESDPNGIGPEEGPSVRSRQANVSQFGRRRDQVVAERICLDAYPEIPRGTRHRPVEDASADKFQVRRGGQHCQHGDDRRCRKQPVPYQARAQDPHP